LPSFDSALGVSDFRKCDPESDSTGSCNRRSADFDASNVTLVFNGNQFKIYRRVNERKFISVTNKDTNIPWNANRAKTSSIEDFFKIDDRIDGAVFTNLENDSFKREANIYSNDTVYTFSIDDKVMNEAFTIVPIDDSPALFKKGNGGIVLDNQIFYIVDNKFYKYNIGNTKLEDTVC